MPCQIYLFRCAVLCVVVALGAASLPAEEDPGHAATPERDVIRLFNGKNLDGLYTYLRDTKYDDPEWTRMDVICDGDRVTILVNGVKANEGFNVRPAAGKLTIQSEMAEIFIRCWELWPLGKAPAYSPGESK